MIANLGIAGVTSSLLAARAIFWCAHGRVVGAPSAFGLLKIMVLAALAEATADTVSSEIGQAFGGLPFMLTTLRRVEVGADGAVSLLGTASGVFAAWLVVFAGMWALKMQPTDAAIALVGAVAGLVFDSFLGATVERRGWMGNDLVNFASTLFAAVVAFGLMALFA